MASHCIHAPKLSYHYPCPLTVAPTTTHNQTIIILHGRGSNALDFGSALLTERIPIHNSHNLRTLFPSTKFIFPTAPKSRAKSFNRSIINQWFDNHSPLSVASQSENEDWQSRGLRETTVFIHGLLRHEVSLVGADKVILGGLSQGCAASLIAGLLWDGPPLKAMFGMCGWLPLRQRMEEIAHPGPPAGGPENSPSTDLFERGEGDPQDPPTQALQYLREELEFEHGISSPPLPYRQTPLFLGHGIEDQKVPLGLSRGAARCLNILGMKMTAKAYAGLGHWYSGEMLRDVVDFLRDVGVEVKEEAEGEVPSC